MGQDFVNSLVGTFNNILDSFYTSTMVAVAPFTGHACQLLDLHQESLERIEAVILSQRLVEREKNPPCS